MKSILPIAAVACFMLAPAAHAAPYRVYACDGPDDGPLSMRPFETYEIPAQTMNHDDYCREPYGTALFEWRAGTLPADQTGGWLLRAPSGTSLTQLRWRGDIAGLTRSGARVELDTDRGIVAAWTTDLGNDTRTFPLPPGATVIALRQACRSAVCTGPVRTTIRALTATLDDPDPPTASDVTGPPATAHGTAVLTFAAADEGSGLARAALYVDGVVRATALACPSLPGDAHGFQSLPPCERAAPVELTWASAGVRDGTHTVSAQLEDAAGNARTVFGPVTITADNAPPVVGAVTVSGTRRAGEPLTAAATGFDGQAVAYAYRWQRCDGECEDIGGADRARYVLSGDDAGRRVRAIVTARDQGGTTEVASDLSRGAGDRGRGRAEPDRDADAVSRAEPDCGARAGGRGSRPGDRRGGTRPAPGTRGPVLRRRCAPPARRGAGVTPPRSGDAGVSPPAQRGGAGDAPPAQRGAARASPALRTRLPARDALTPDGPARLWPARRDPRARDRRARRAARRRAARRPGQTAYPRCPRAAGGRRGKRGGRAFQLRRARRRQPRAADR